MSIISTTNVHHVVSIDVEIVDHGTFVSHQFRLTLEDGGVVEFDAFSDAALRINVASEVRRSHATQEDIA